MSSLFFSTKTLFFHVFVSNGLSIILPLTGSDCCVVSDNIMERNLQKNKNISLPFSLLLCVTKSRSRRTLILILKSCQSFHIVKISQIFSHDLENLLVDTKLCFQHNTLFVFSKTCSVSKLNIWLKMWNLWRDFKRERE